MLSSEYGWTDEHILNLTTDRISQCVRQITSRKRQNFTQNAKLLELAVRNMAMFSAQSEKAAKAASEIVLIHDPSEPVGLDRSMEETQSKVILPPGVDRPKHQPKIEEVISKVDVVVDEVPDDEDRVVAGERPEEDLNRTGSFENILSLFGTAQRGT